MPEHRTPDHGRSLSADSNELDFTVSWHKVSMYGHWWNLITRWRWWRWKRRIERDWKKLPPDHRAAAEVMQRRIDHLMFFGEDKL